MNKTLKNILLISAIIPATILLGLSLIVSPNVLPFTFRDYRGFFMTMSLAFGFVGYFGLWRTLLFNEPQNLKLNIILLFFGLLSFIIFMMIEGCNHFQIKDFKDIGSILLFVWPSIVAILILVNNFIQIKNNKTLE